MKIRVIGCSGAELPGHNAPAFLLDDEILFDAGSLTGVLNERAQLRIKNIFITHAHLDHIRSIPFLADNIVVGGSNSKVTIFSIFPVIRTIKTHLFNSAVWPDFTIIPNPHDAILNLVELKAGQSIKIDGYTVVPYKVNHTVPAVGYLVEDRHRRRFFYSGDTGPSPNTWKRLMNKKIHCLIIDVSFPSGMRELALRTGHLTPDLLGAELARIKPLPGRIFITHPKPQYVKAIKREIDSLKFRNIRILKDGDIIRV